jgi:hypothetical protein
MGLPRFFLLRWNPQKTCPRWEESGSTGTKGKWIIGLRRLLWLNALALYKTILDDWMAGSEF